MRTQQTTPSAMYAACKIIFTGAENTARAGTKTHALIEFLRSGSGKKADKLFAAPIKNGDETLYLQACDLVWAAQRGIITVE